MEIKKYSTTVCGDKLLIGWHTIRGELVSTTYTTTNNLINTLHKNNVSIVDGHIETIKCNIAQFGQKSRKIHELLINRRLLTLK